MRALRILPALLLLWAAIALAAPKPRAPRIPKMAEELFQKYARLEEAYDAALAELYADTAVIRNRRVTPNGEVQETSLTAKQYKEVLGAGLPSAKERGDQIRYSNVIYRKAGQKVRIHAIRYSLLNESSTPFSLLVGPAEDGTWRIYEEVRESRP